MLTNEQIETRRSGLAATDMTILAGVSPYGRTPHDVYLDKVGEPEPREQSFAMSLGHRLEPVALAILAEAKGLTLTPGTTERHPIYSWVLATPDANVLDTGTRVGVAEAKAVGLHMAHRWGTDDDAIPDEVRVQTAWQMITTRTKIAHVVALIGTDARFYEIEHDEDLASALLEMGDIFWTKHVLDKTPPEFDGSEGSARMVRSLFKRSTAGLITAPVDAEKWAREYISAKREEDQASERRATAQAHLCAAIAEHEGMTGENWIATWKERASGGVDWKGMAEKLGATPDLTKRYTRPGGRVFLLKTKKEKAA